MQQLMLVVRMEKSAKQMRYSLRKYKTLPMLLREATYMREEQLQDQTNNLQIGHLKTILDR